MATELERTLRGCQALEEFILALDSEISGGARAEQALRALVTELARVIRARRGAG